LNDAVCVRLRHVQYLLKSEVLLEHEAPGRWRVSGANPVAGSPPLTRAILC